jgi:peptide/nickel transport system permease protein
MGTATSISAGSIEPNASADPAAPAEKVQTFVQRVTRHALSGIGARLGLLWIGIIAALAILAPLLANTHPLLMKMDGVWSSPWWTHLTPLDISLLAIPPTAALAYFVPRLRARTRVLAFLGAIAVLATIAGIFKHVPDPIYYRIYRMNADRIEVAYYAPIRFSPNDQLNDQEHMEMRPPSREHLLGTTSFAADLASNMIYATRIALSIGFVATGVAVVLGVIMGGVMGYFGGRIDLIGMRLVEIFESVPTLLLLLAFSALFQETGMLGLFYMMVIIGVTNSFGYAEFVRAEFLTLRDRDFVHAARAAGLPTASILFRHILPNGLTPVIVNVSFGVAGAILTESTLSFLGIGLKNEASWGNLLEQAVSSAGKFSWWLALFPGGAIFLTVFSYNLIGEGLRDALDPRTVRAKE